jgi:tetratricopeptide (TPR) repeat protein
VDDPANSRVALRLMRALDGAGERAAAIRHAGAHAAWLREEYGAPPDPDVEAFVARLRAVAAPPPATALEPIPRPSIPERAEPVIPALVPEPARTPTVRPADPAESSPPIAERQLPAPLRRRPHPWHGAAAAVVLAAGLWIARTVQGPASAAGMDTGTYVVLPFAQRPSAGPAMLTPDGTELLLHGALGRWNDLRLVDALRAQDAAARQGSVRTLGDALRVAHALGAGRLLWGEFVTLGDSVVVEGALYDVERGGSTIRRGSVRLARDLRDASGKFDFLAAELMGTAPTDGRPAAHTPSLAAAQAYRDGWGALERWDLDSARQALTRATASDPGFAAAHLWLAQVTAWSGGRPAEWRESAVRAEADGAALSLRERMLARGLVALADERFPEACHAYAALLARDSADFAAWYGVGECNTRDERVVRDARSPSGWVFRGSTERAVRAYLNALRLVPSSYLAFRRAGFARLERVLITDARKVRMGYTVARDTLQFAAYPMLQADTLGFVPYPANMFASLDPRAIPATRADALRHNRQLLYEFMSAWVRAFPTSGEAHQGLSQSLEAVGSLEAVRQGQPSALTELARARELNREPDRALALSVAQARLWLKLGRFARARAVADSVLAHADSTDSHDAQRMLPLAVLTGRAALAVELARKSAPEAIPFAMGGNRLQIPVPVSVAYADVLVYASLGLPAQEAEAERRLDRAIRTWVDARLREDVRAVLLTLPRRMTPPGTMIGAPLRTDDRVLELRQDLARGDTAKARAGLARLRELRRDRRPGDITIDAVVAETQLLLAADDTASAEEELESSLGALAAFPGGLLDRVPDAASVPRAMLMRADVALAHGDLATARQWADAAAVLWSGADPPLRMRVEQLRSATARGPRR